MRTIAVTAALLGAGAAVALIQPSDKAKDKAAVAETIDALYASISGPAGSHEDFAEFRDLFDEQGHLTAIAHRQGDGSTVVIRMTPDQWVERSGAAINKNGFFETGLHNTIEIFGSVAHVWSTYDSKSTADGEPFARGINSIQLLKDPESGEWKILSILWDSETPEQPIPARYLPGE